MGPSLGFFATWVPFTVFVVLEVPDLFLKGFPITLYLVECGFFLYTAQLMGTVRRLRFNTGKCCCLSLFYK